MAPHGGEPGIEVRPMFTNSTIGNSGRSLAAPRNSSNINVK